jgi:hypothetical protein
VLRAELPFPECCNHVRDGEVLHHVSQSWKHLNLTVGQNAVKTDGLPVNVSDLVCAAGEKQDREAQRSIPQAAADATIKALSSLDARI